MAAGVTPTYTPQSFAEALLREVGAKPTANSVGAVNAWEAQEGGNWHNEARYNPLNTTMNEPGAGNQPGGQGNIKAYQNWQQGLQATASTLKLPAYQGVVGLLRAGASPAQVEAAINQSPWGTKFTDVGSTGVESVPPGYGVTSGQAQAAPASGQAVQTPAPTEPNYAAILAAATAQQAPQLTRPTATSAVYDQGLNRISAPPQAESGSQSLAALLKAAAAPDTGSQQALTGQSAASGSTAQPGGSAAIQWAHSQIGHDAESQGPNLGPELDKLEESFGMTGEPWCAMFATTVTAHGGASTAGRSASVAQINQWAAEGSHGYQKGFLSTRQAQPGDLITFGNQHVAVVTKVLPEGVATIQGNADGSGGVNEQLYGFNTGQIVRPVYK